MSDNTPESIIERATATLGTARMGYQDYVGDDVSRRIAGLNNAIVFGRAVTNVIENLRGKVLDFDDWYLPRSAALAAIPEFKRLYQIRSEILKQGRSGTSVSVYVASLSGSDMSRMMENPPPGARGFFIGDQAGGSGWEVELPDGQVAKYYVSIPSSVRVSVTLEIEVSGESVDVRPVLERYLKAMQDIVDAAKLQFA